MAVDFNVWGKSVAIHRDGGFGPSPCKQATIGAGLVADVIDRFAVVVVKSSRPFVGGRAPDPTVREVRNGASHQHMGGNVMDGGWQREGRAAIIPGPRPAVARQYCQV